MTANLVLALFALIPAAFGLAVVHFFATQPAARAERRAWPRLLAGNGLVVLLLASALLFAGELYYRFVYDTTDAFGLARVTREWMLEHEHMNQFGFRDSVEYELDRRPDKRRVTFVGDSFTAGFGVRDVEQRFANRVRRAHPEWDVQVLATDGFDTGAEEKLLENLAGARYGFDLVVLAYCMNDIADIAPEWQTLQASLYRRERPPFLIDQSYCLNTLYYRWMSARTAGGGYYDFVLDAYRGPLWNKQRARLATLAQLVRESGGELAVVVFPFLHRLGADYPYAAVHDQLGSAFDELGVRHLDLVATYADRAPASLVVNSRDPHPNELAHEPAARAIEPFIAAALAARGQ